MTEQVSGRCFCGAIRYRFDHKPLAVRTCWCRDCQYLACGNASVGAFFRRAGLTLEGEPAAYVSQAASGNTMRRRFCARCGTHLFSEAEARPDTVVVRVGTLEDREIGGPSSIIWAASAPAWAKLDPALPVCEGQPATPPEPPPG
ncbi:GFA family protein [Teichococcus vastitatis]|uniref:GFA family protein n=1 Tax=Teichococcus vastitatis TaxID=2307076 RepID=A0ABS9W3A8_9PROT|nr:GFA family protein [Pseudoroseomonas vastitatis]MCI0753777.1 GFA family protein [Pseudoroseomonas vastitatis]